MRGDSTGRFDSEIHNKERTKRDTKTTKDDN